MNHGGGSSYGEHEKHWRRRALRSEHEGDTPMGSNGLTSLLYFLAFGLFFGLVFAPLYNFFLVKVWRHAS